MESYLFMTHPKFGSGLLTSLAADTLFAWFSFAFLIQTLLAFQTSFLDLNLPPFLNSQSACRNFSQQTFSAFYWFSRSDYRFLNIPAGEEGGSMPEIQGH